MKKNILSGSIVTLAAVTVLIVGIPSVSADTATELNTVNTEIDAAQQKLDSAQGEVSANLKLQLEKAAEIDKLDKDIAAHESQLKNQARSAQLNGTDTVVTFITDSDNLSDLASRTFLVVTLFSANRRAWDQQKADKEKVAADKKTLAKSGKKLHKLQITLLQASSQLVSKRAELNAKKHREDKAAQEAAAKAQ